MAQIICQNLMLLEKLLLHQKNLFSENVLADDSLKGTSKNSSRADSKDFFVSAKERKVEEYWMYFPLFKREQRRKKAAAPPQTSF